MNALRPAFRILAAPLFVSAALALAIADARACRYCELAADPEAYRFMTERRPAGSFPPDSALGGYDGGAAGSTAVTPPAPPAAANLVTSADDLQKLTAHQTAAPIAPAPPAASPAGPRRVPPPTPPTPAVSAPPAVAAGMTNGGTFSSVRLADLGLAGIVGALLFFVWRTRRRAQPATVA